MAMSETTTFINNFRHALKHVFLLFIPNSWSHQLFQCHLFWMFLLWTYSGWDWGDRPSFYTYSCPYIVWITPVVLETFSWLTFVKGTLLIINSWLGSQNIPTSPKGLNISWCLKCLSMTECMLSTSWNCCGQTTLFLFWQTQKSDHKLNSWIFECQTSPDLGFLLQQLQYYSQFYHECLHARQQRKISLVSGLSCWMYRVSFWKKEFRNSRYRERKHILQIKTKTTAFVLSLLSVSLSACAFTLLSVCCCKATFWVWDRLSLSIPSSHLPHLSFFSVPKTQKCIHC